MAFLKYIGLIASHFPTAIIQLRSLKSLHKFLNFNGSFEKLPIMMAYVCRAMIANQHNERWAIRADKYAVRKEIEHLIGCQYLVPSYGFWEDPEDIDFDVLPSSFILKTNNGCGTNIFVHDKSNIDRAAIITQLKKSLSFPYPQLSGQLHYALIKPGVVAEKMMCEKGHRSLTDYKVHCINGKPQRIYVFLDRGEKDHFHFKMMAFDTNWNPIPDAVNEPFRAEIAAIPRPEQLDEMLELAHKLSADDEYVRVDFYIINNQIYFGELTYTPDTAINAAYPPEGMNALLDKIKADRHSGKSKAAF